MRFPWPQTLLWRTFLLIALLMGLSLFAWFQIYNQFAIKPRTRQTAQMLVSVVNLTRAALLASDANQQTALLRNLISIEGIRIYPAEPSDLVTPVEDSELIRNLSTELRQRLGPSTRLASAIEGQPGFYISFILDTEVPDDQYWLMIPAERVPHRGVAGWIGWGIATGLLSLVGAYLLVFGITRPLKALEQAARKVGQGELPPPLTERGSREIVAVASAFNQMSRDLTQLESDRALILAGVSHDLRTPLSRLRLGIELSGASSDDVSAMGEDIDEMDRIIGQFLDFARDAQAEMAEPCDLSAFMNDIVEAYRRRGLQITLHSDALPPHAVRAHSLRRAIANLIDNAWRYAGEELPIELALTREGAQLNIDVADRGPGIPPDQVERLKRPFTRLEEARSNARGSGLGLAIVERIARLHDGSLELLPRPGGGLLARISLPA
ncbi:ATP-binding protein [Uliginosibacterium sp. H3]|uniref:histidine kinase n=1 Tax=Uliginosibacterium silvisoli TaxID=3114758 RepID=A0ABU6K726_9RHOO|nr:ATP-binding protein [Uliginosibacterium sp. H3]